MTPKTLAYGTIALISLIAIYAVGSSIFGYITGLREDVATLSNDLANTNAALSQAVEKLISDDDRLRALERQSSSLASAQQRIQSESALRLAALSAALTNTQSGLDLSSVIKSWRPYIARISCTIETPTATADTTGSALLSRTFAYPYAHLITNRHVLMYDGYSAESCKITFPDLSGSIAVGGGDISYPSKSDDIGMVDIGQASDVIDVRAQNAVGRKICSSVSVGEKVVILGYPNIGSKSDVTATEGIISGFDGDYYITSAKIEQGNSGGAAILIRGSETCYLGIPTFVNIGKIEALARILSAKVLQ